MVQLTIEKADEPKSISVRKRIVAWVLEQELAGMALGADAETVALGQEIALDVLGAELGREASRARYRAMLEEAITSRRERTVGEVLAELGVSVTPDFEALAAASWPAVRSALSSPTAKAWFASVIAEFYDQEIAASAP